MFSEASEEILKVEQKYNKLRRPFYDKRNDIIKRIPKFWLTAFINHPQVCKDQRGMYFLLSVSKIDF